jgi:hypothetical protein
MCFIDIISNHKFKYLILLKKITFTSDLQRWLPFIDSHIVYLWLLKGHNFCFRVYYYFNARYFIIIIIDIFSELISKKLNFIEIICGMIIKKLTFHSFICKLILDKLKFIGLINELMIKKTLRFCDLVYIFIHSVLFINLPSKCDFMLLV